MAGAPQAEKVAQTLLTVLKEQGLGTLMALVLVALFVYTAYQWRQNQQEESRLDYEFSHGLTDIKSKLDGIEREQKAFAQQQYLIQQKLLDGANQQIYPTPAPH